MTLFSAMQHLLLDGHEYCDMTARSATTEEGTID